MIALIQRVTGAHVEIGGQITASIGRGLVALVGVRSQDDEAVAEHLLDRVLGYRVFPDDAGKMNLSLPQIGGGLLVVPQFTLAADTRHGRRPGFSTAAAPEVARRLFAAFERLAASKHAPFASGVFGADMRVSLTNDGPVTFWLES